MSKRSRNARRHMASQKAVNNVMPAEMKIVEPTNVNVADQKFEIIPLDKMFLAGYQRKLSDTVVDNMTEHFDAGRVGVLIVSQRKDGTYAVLDGQHRMTALRRLGFTHAICIVLRDMSEADEADYFRHQHDNTRRLTARDKYKASVCANDEKTLKIQAILTKNTFYAETGGQGTRIEAVAALNAIVDIYGYEILDYALELAAATWPGNKQAVCREMLVALAEFSFRFSQMVSVVDFQTRLGERNPSEILRMIRQRNESGTLQMGTFSKQVRFTACGVLVAYYNRGLGTKSKKRLHLQWDLQTDED